MLSLSKNRLKWTFRSSYYDLRQKLVSLFVEPIAKTSGSGALNCKKTGTIPANSILKPTWRLTCGSICESAQSPTR